MSNWRTLFLIFQRLRDKRWWQVPQRVKRSIKTKPPQRWDLLSMHSWIITRWIYVSSHILTLLLVFFLLHRLLSCVSWPEELMGCRPPLSLSLLARYVSYWMLWVTSFRSWRWDLDIWKHSVVFLEIFHKDWKHNIYFF